jgi:hypothetical protein
MLSGGHLDHRHCGDERTKSWPTWLQRRGARLRRNGQSPSGTGQAGVTPSVSGVQRQSAQNKAAANADKGAWTSILWTMLALAAVAGATLLITVRRGQFGAKVGGFFKEITGIGRKGGRDDPRNRM